MFPPISIVGPLFDMWRDDRPLRHLARADHPLPDLRAAAVDLHVLSAFFREIPWDLEQAAQVDGATPFQAFRKVILPLAAPGVFTAAILVFIFCWNDFVFAISLTSTDARADRARGDRLLHRRIAVHRADRRRSPPRRSS